MKKLMFVATIIFMFTSFVNGAANFDSTKDIYDGTGNNPWRYLADTEVFSGKKLVVYILTASEYVNTYQAPFLVIRKTEGKDLEIYFTCGDVAPNPNTKSLSVRVGSGIFEEECHTGSMRKYLFLYPPTSTMWTMLKVDAIKGVESELAISIPDIAVQARWKVHNLKKVLAELGCP